MQALGQTSDGQTSDGTNIGRTNVGRDKRRTGQTSDWDKRRTGTNVERGQLPSKTSGSVTQP